MPLQREVYYDGDYDEPQQDGPIVVTVDPINRAKIWTQNLTQRVSFWQAMPLDSDGPLGGYLVEETVPQILDADVVKWQRIFAEVPAVHSLPTVIAHAYQRVSVAGTTYVVQQVRTTTAMVEHRYFRTATPDTIEILRPPVYQNIGGAVFRYDGSLPATADPQIAQDSSIERWRGNIWVRKTPMVKALPPPTTLT